MLSLPKDLQTNAHCRFIIVNMKRVRFQFLLVDNSYITLHNFIVNRMGSSDRGRMRSCFLRFCQRGTIID